MLNRSSDALALAAYSPMLCLVLVSAGAAWLFPLIVHATGSSPSLADADRGA